MTHSVKNIALVTVPTLVLLYLVLEVVFRFIIVAPDPPRQCMDIENNVMRFDTKGKRDGVFTVGRFGQQRGRWHINNYGWLSGIEYRRKDERSKPLVAVIGDSFVEALQVDEDESFVALLRRALEDSFDVYGFGFAGAPLSGYLHLARYVGRVFEPDILVINMCYNDFDESVREVFLNPEFLQVSVRGATVVEVPPVPRHYNRLKRFLFHSAAQRYIFYLAPGFFHRLNWNKPRAQGLVENVHAGRLGENRAVITEATRYLMGTIVAENPGKKIYFIMDAPRREIYEGSVGTGQLAWIHGMVADIAGGLPCVLVDQTDYFKRDWENNRRKFESQYDSHWNEYGHFVTYRQLLEVLREGKE